MSVNLMYNSNQNRKESIPSFSRPQHGGAGGRTVRHGSHAPKNTVLISALANATQGKLHLCSSEADLPRLGTLVVRPMHIAQDESLSELRHRTRDYAAREHVSIERQQDLETAVGEAATNAVVHGGGGTGSVYAVSGLKIQICISDEGPGITEEHIPQATLIRGFSTKDTLGHGMKMILQAVDRVYLLTGTRGTTIVLEQDIRKSRKS